MIFLKNKNIENKPILISLISWVLIVKLTIFLIDPTVMFFIDDSSRYLDTAISSFIPPDRSFLYGFLIRWITYFNQSLTYLVFFQVLCSAASAVLSGYVLNKFLSVKRNVATGFAVLCAVAPIQLLYERYVLTETVSLLVFSLYVTAAFFYLKEPKIKTLVLLNLAGVFLIAFRLSYLPIVLCGTVLVPLLAFFNVPVGRDKDDAEDLNRRLSVRRRVISASLNILVSCLLTYGLHYAYKNINGRLSNKPPAYQYRDGYHLLASWAPLLQKEDFADPGISGYTQQYFYFHLEDRFQRMNHRWGYYGLIRYIHRMYDSSLKTNKIAHDTAMNILYRNPFGVMKLAWQSYMDYWDIGILKNTLVGDRCTSEYSKGLIEVLKSHYHIDAQGFSSKETFTNQYFLNAMPWYMFLFSLPLIMAISIVMDKRHHIMPLALIGFFALLIMMNSTALLHRNTMRFFHPDEWMAIIFLGVMFDRMLKRGFVQAIGRKLRVIK